MKFEYEIDEEEDFQALDTTFAIQRDSNASEKIELRLGTGSTDSCIAANLEGWLYLAKVCVEMAHLSRVDPIFHTHRTEKFRNSDSNSVDVVMLAQLPKP